MRRRLSEFSCVRRRIAHARSETRVIVTSQVYVRVVYVVDFNLQLVEVYELASIPMEGQELDIILTTTKHCSKSCQQHCKHVCDPSRKTCALSGIIGQYWFTSIA